MKLIILALFTTLAAAPMAFANDSKVTQQSEIAELKALTPAASGTIDKATDDNEIEHTTTNTTTSFPESFKPQGEAVLGLQSLASQQQDIQAEHWSGLPFLGKKAREMGYKLPIPLGFNVYFNQQEVAYVAQDDFKLGLEKTDWQGNITESTLTLPADLVSITGEDESVQFRLDAWVLPFWNVYALAGYTKGFKTIGIDLTEHGMRSVSFDLNYEAYNLGIGNVLAGQVEVIPGMHPFIFTGVLAFSNSWTTTTDSTIQTYIGSFRTGQRYTVPGGQLAVLLGYNYQLINQNISGSLESFKLGPNSYDLSYDVDLKSKDTGNMSVTMVYDFGPKQEWNLFLEYGFLNWDQVIFSIGRRF